MTPRFKLSEKWAPYVFIAPFVALFAVFGFFPLLFSIGLALCSWSPAAGFESIRFVGLDNFRFALTDAWFWRALGNTAKIAILSGVPQHLCAIPLAAFLARMGARARNLYVGAFFAPYITSTVAMSILFMAIFSTNYGLINQLLHALHLIDAPIHWLESPRTIQPSIEMIIFWRYVGFNTVIYLAALQAIPSDLYEAARIEGAGPFQQFRYITLPSLKPVAYFAVTLTVIGGLQIFDEAFILTNGQGGADQAGLTAALYLYREAFDFDDLGGASAMSWILFGIVTLVTLINHWLFRDRGAQA